MGQVKDSESLSESLSPGEESQVPVMSSWLSGLPSVLRVVRGCLHSLPSSRASRNTVCYQCRTLPFQYTLAHLCLQMSTSWSHDPETSKSAGPLSHSPHFFPLKRVCLSCFFTALSGILPVPAVKCRATAQFLLHSNPKG